MCYVNGISAYVRQCFSSEQGWNVIFVPCELKCKNGGKWIGRFVKLWTHKLQLWINLACSRAHVIREMTYNTYIIFVRQQYSDGWRCRFSVLMTAAHWSWGHTTPCLCTWIHINKAERWIIKNDQQTYGPNQQTGPTPAFLKKSRTTFRQHYIPSHIFQTRVQTRRKECTTGLGDTICEIVLGSYFSVQLTWIPLMGPISALIHLVDNHWNAKIADQFCDFDCQR